MIELTPPLLYRRRGSVAKHHKQIFEEKDHSQVVKVVEDMVGLHNDRYKNNVVRKMVWKREGSELVISGTPTADRIRVLKQKTKKEAVEQQQQTLQQAFARQRQGTTAEGRRANSIERQMEEFDTHD